MLRMDRSTLNTLPYPVFEIQAERLSADEIRVGVMVGQGLCSQLNEFALTEREAFNSLLLRWLLSLPYFGQGHEPWQNAAIQAAAAITGWAYSAEAHSPANRFGFLSGEIEVPDDFDQMDYDGNFPGH